MALVRSGVMMYARGERSCAQTGFSEDAVPAIEQTSMKARSGLISAFAAFGREPSGPALSLGLNRGIIQRFRFVKDPIFAIAES